MSETELVRSILAELAKLKVWSWRVNSGVFGARHIRGAPPGTPDILGVLPGGVLFGLEAKAGNRERSESQIEWHETARFHGVRVEVVRSVGHAVTTVVRWKEETLAAIRVPGEGAL